MPEDTRCIATEDGETCLVHCCNAHEHCMKEGCPHCDLPQNKYHKLKLTNSYLKSKDAGEVE